MRSGGRQRCRAQEPCPHDLPLGQGQPGLEHWEHPLLFGAKMTFHLHLQLLEHPARLRAARSQGDSPADTQQTGNKLLLPEARPTGAVLVGAKGWIDGLPFGDVVLDDLPRE